MPRILVRNRELAPACNAAQLLEAWLVPGVLSWRVGQIAAALHPHASPLQKHAERLLHEHVELDTFTGKPRMVDILDDAFVHDPAVENGQRRVQQVVGKDYVWKDRAAYESRLDALQSQTVEVDIPKLLTEDHAQAIAADRVKVHPTDANGRALPAPSFGALACVMESTAVLAPPPSAT